MTPKQTYSILILLVISMLASACQFNVSRNGDGTLTVDTSITQEQLQSEISSAIADPLIREITVSLQSGYLLVTGKRQRLNDASKTDALSFRLDLGASNGQLHVYDLRSAVGRKTDRAKPRRQLEPDHRQPHPEFRTKAFECNAANGFRDPGRSQHDVAGDEEINTEEDPSLQTKRLSQDGRNLLLIEQRWLQSLANQMRTLQTQRYRDQSDPNPWLRAGSPAMECKDF